MKYTVRYNPEKGKASGTRVRRYDVSDGRSEMAQAGKAVEKIEDPSVIMQMYAGEWVETPFGERQLYRVEGGGLIESPYNLSQVGQCWVHPGAKVIGDTRVVGDAQVYGGTISGGVICGRAEISGENTIISGSGMIAGKISGSKVYQYSVVLEGGEVKDGSKVGVDKGEDDGADSQLARAIIGGTVENSWVHRQTRVYGSVKGKCTIGVNAVVSPGAEVEGKVLVYNAVVNGSVKVI